MIPRFRGQCQGGARGGLAPNGAGGRVPFGTRGMPRPTGAAQVVHSSGPMYLRDGLRPYAPRGDEGRHAGSSCPTGGCGEPSRLPWPAAHSGAFAARVRRNGWESRQSSPPKWPATLDNPSVSLRLTAPFAQGSLGDGGCGSPRRPVGPPRNYNGFLSFRGAERRGNPFPFTMDGGSGRRGRRPLRPAGDGGTARRGRRALRVVAGRSHQLPGQRLAKRKARKEQLVKFGLCPMTSERSTAYWVRKSDESPARALVGAASTEQNGLEPHPAARQGASRP